MVDLLEYLHCRTWETYKSFYLQKIIGRHQQGGIFGAGTNWETIRKGLGWSKHPTGSGGKGGGGLMGATLHPHSIQTCSIMPMSSSRYHYRRTEAGEEWTWEGWLIGWSYLQRLSARCSIYSPKRVYSDWCTYVHYVASDHEMESIPPICLTLMIQCYTLFSSLVKEIYCYLLVVRKSVILFLIKASTVSETIKFLFF